MTSLQDDLFADPVATLPSARDKLAADAAHVVLEKAMADAGRKTAFKALEPELRESLAEAAGVVAVAKANAYEQASRGEFLDSFGWMSRNPLLAGAVALLNRHFIDSSDIQMARAS